MKKPGKPRRDDGSLRIPATDAEFYSLSAEELSKLGEHLSRKRGRPLSAAEKTRLDRARSKPQQQRIYLLTPPRRRGRPTIGKGAKAILISMEQDLLSQVDRYAKAHRLSRSQLIAQALKTVIGKAG